MLGNPERGGRVAGCRCAADEDGKGGFHYFRTYADLAQLEQLHGVGNITCHTPYKVVANVMKTAELPGIYQESELDFAGTCVGLVERDRVIDGSRCEAGDVVIGFRSSGLHTNGFSLVRSLVGDGDGDFDADLLLAPHTLYLQEIRQLQERADVRGLAHVTGGGLLGNLSRVLPEGLEARIDWDAWERPRVFTWLTEQGIEEDELRRVFNVGIGMCAVVPEAPPDATVIGELA